ncbi:tyrosine-type recombinase/integrase [Candidatus Berkelbacteria bacterium]|nr:tyrosine-type recombinase/integrase [Candidatus Berkelbacteria bacterium]
MKISEAIRQFLEHSEIEKGRSFLTIRNYQHYLERFLKFLESEEAEKKIETAEEIDLETIRKFRLYLNRLGKEGLSKSTQNYHLIALRAFLKYLASRDIKSLSPEKIDLAKTTEREITFLTSEEVEKMMEATEPSKNIIGLRDRAILETLFSTGLRVSELVALAKDQINLESGEFSVKGKGGKIRVVFLSPEAKEWLTKYLNKRTDGAVAVFVRHGRKKEILSTQTKLNLTPRTIQRIVKYYAKKAGLTKDVVVHSMRHSFATDLLTSGANLRSVQQLLGHASITTTQIYTHITDPQLREVHQAFHGLRRKKEQAKKE